MPFESLSSLMSTVWYSLDDLFVVIGVFLAVNVLARSSEWCLRNYWETSYYVAQTLHFGLLFVVGVFLIGHLIGADVANQMFSGFSIGIGYAMQPYIVSILAGATFKGGSMFSRGSGEQVVLSINGKEYVLDHVGLLYLCATSDGFKTYFPNSMLASTPVSVKKTLKKE